MFNSFILVRFNRCIIILGRLVAAVLCFLRRLQILRNIVPSTTLCTLKEGIGVAIIIRQTRGWSFERVPYVSSVQRSSIVVDSTATGRVHTRQSDRHDAFKSYDRNVRFSFLGYKSNCYSRRSGRERANCTRVCVRICRMRAVPRRNRKQRAITQETGQRHRAVPSERITPVWLLSFGKFCFVFCSILRPVVTCSSTA